MRKILFASAAAIAAIAGAPAFAADSASTTVTASVEPVCSFTTTPGDRSIDGSTTSEQSLGNLGYTCNFVGSAQASLTIANGTNMTNPDNGAAPVPYAVKWDRPDDGTSHGFYQTASSDPVNFAVTTKPAANQEELGALSMQLSSVLNVAGTYSTTMVFTIAP